MPGIHSRRRELRNLPDESPDSKGSAVSAELLSRTAAVQPGAEFRVPSIPGCFRRVFFAGAVSQDRFTRTRRIPADQRDAETNGQCDGGSAAARTAANEREDAIGKPDDCRSAA